MDIGLPELLIILLVVLMFFGSSRLPKLSRSVGESLREMREGFTGKDEPTKTSKNKKKEPQV